MKRVFCQILGCWVMVFFITGAMAHPYLLRVSDRSMCLDGMETVPGDDDLDPTEVAVDGGCMVAPEAVISI
jgi:hypothetical protein